MLNVVAPVITAPAQALLGLLAVVAELFAQSSGAVANDPADPDYQTKTVLRRRHWDFEPLKPDGDQRLLWLIGLSRTLLDAEAKLNAVVRAYERALGASAAGEPVALTLRLEEAEGYASAFGRTSIQVVESANRAANALNELADTGALLEPEPESRRGPISSSLLDLLDAQARDRLYRAGVPVATLRETQVRGLFPAHASAQLAERLEATIEPTGSFGEAMTVWRPSVD